MESQSSLPHLKPVFIKTKIPKEKRIEQIFPEDFISPKAWGHAIFNPKKFLFTLISPQDLPPPVVEFYNDDFNLDKNDKEMLLGEIQPETIRQFLQRTSLDLQQVLAYKFKKISSLYSNPIDVPLSISIPPPINELTSYVHINLSSFSIHGSSNLLKYIKGVLFLYHKDLKTFVSDYSYFTTVDGKVEFSQGRTDTFFQVRGDVERIRLGCILMHPYSFHKGNWIANLGSPKPPSSQEADICLPFAFSSGNPFKRSKPNFHFPWMVLNSPDFMTTLFSSPREWETQVSIIGKFASEIIPASPLCNVIFKTLNPALLLHQYAYDPPPRLYFSNITLTFSSQPKAELLYFECKIFDSKSDKPSEFSPEQLTVFSSPKGIIDKFTSIKMESAKKITFPDIVRLDFESIPTKMAFIQFEIKALNPSSTSKNNNQTLFISVMPLFINETPIPEINLPEQMLSLYNSNSFKLEEALTKYKSTSKTGLYFQMNCHPLIGQPLPLGKLCLAQVPMQIKWGEIRHLPKMILENNFLPILIKLLSLISPISVPFFLDFIRTVPNLTILKSWIHNSFKPSDLKHNFLSSFTNAFAQWLTTTLDTTKDYSTFSIFVSNFDIISDLFLISYYRKSEKWLPSFLFFERITSLICRFSKRSEIQKMNTQYGQLLYIFLSICEEEEKIKNLIVLHIRELLQVDAFKLIFEFFIPFTYSSDFVLTCAQQLPVCALSEIMFVPYHPIFSILSFAISKILSYEQDVSESSKSSSNPSQNSQSTKKIRHHRKTDNFDNGNEKSERSDKTEKTEKTEDRNLIQMKQVSQSQFFLEKEKKIDPDSEVSKAITLCCQVLTRLCLPLEEENVSLVLRYRTGFLLFSFLDVISSRYDASFTPEQQYQILPIILFLLGYTPTQLLKNFFVSCFQSPFISFLDSAVKACILKLTPEISVVNGVFDQLTQRIAQFLMLNINMFKNCINSVIALLSTLILCPYQTTFNFPRLFDIVSRIIFLYPGQRNLVLILLNEVSSKQHIARCFATSLIVLFFKADYNIHNSLAISSVEVLDELTKILLHASSDEQINIYLKMLSHLKTLIKDFQSQVLTDAMTERVNAAQTIANVAIDLRKTVHPTDEFCVYVMKIADQYKTYPSMRLKWLSKIVEINLNAQNFASAFVSQLHVCALIATIIEHEELISLNDQNVESNHNNSDLTNLFNLKVCQPIQNGKIFEGKKVELTPKQDFSFIPTVLVETEINFKVLSEDFQFISEDFTIDLLLQEISKAIEIGKKAFLFYSVRCLISLEIRFYSVLRNYSALTTSFHELSDVLSKISTSNCAYDNNLTFYLVKSNQNPPTKNRIYCVDKVYEKIFLEQHDKFNIEKLRISYETSQNGEVEHPHCWSYFRTLVTAEDAKKLPSAKDNCLKLVQYITEEELPRYTMFSEVKSEDMREISLVFHVSLEVKRFERLMKQIRTEFERCFPSINPQSTCHPYPPNFEGDMQRISNVLTMIVEGDDSLRQFLLILREKGEQETAKKFVEQLLPSMELLLQVYNSAVYTLNNILYIELYKVILEAINSFLKEFGIQKHLNTSPYEGKKDSLTQKLPYE